MIADHMHQTNQERVILERFTRYELAREAQARRARRNWYILLTGLIIALIGFVIGRQG
jgi:hypothetical protein